MVNCFFLSKSNLPQIQIPHVMKVIGAEESESVIRFFWNRFQMKIICEKVTFFKKKQFYSEVCRKTFGSSSLKF